MNTDHVVINLVTGKFLCEHCGATSDVVLPMLVSEISKSTRGFLKAHRYCHPSEKAKLGLRARKIRREAEQWLLDVEHQENLEPGRSGQTAAEIEAVRRSVAWLKQVEAQAIPGGAT